MGFWYICRKLAEKQSPVNYLFKILVIKQPYILFLLISLCFSLAYADSNLALHKSYMILSKPSYKHCTDKGDIFQLTDGVRDGSKWMRKSTVGWEKLKPAVEVVIDLEKSEVIRQVIIYTVGGGFAGVEFPELVAVLVSEDGQNFYFVGKADNKGYSGIRSVGTSSVARTMIIDDIQARGRYVKVVLKPYGRYLFLDEIEIFGREKSSDRKVSRQFIKNTNELLTVLQGTVKIKESVLGLKKEFVEQRSKFKNEFRDRLLVQIDELVNKVTFKQKNRLTKDKGAERKLGKIRAKIFREFYTSDFVCTVANPMEVLHKNQLYLQDPVNNFEIFLWQNEYESAAFNIINCTDTELELAVSISPVTAENGKSFLSKDIVTVRRSAYINASMVGEIADPLIRLEEKPFKLKAGEVGQVWLTVHDPKLKPGNYQLQAAILAKGSDGIDYGIRVLDIKIEVSENLFPDEVSLNTYNWSYYTSGSINETASDLKQHYINIAVIDSINIPFYRRTSDKPGVWRKLDFGRIDKFLSRHRYGDKYLLYLNFNKSNRDWGRFGKWMSAEWKIKFSKWLDELSRYLLQKGIDSDHWFLYPFDETLCEEFYQVASFIKQSNPKVKLFANSFGKGPRDIKRFSRLIDIWCPPDLQSQRHPDWLELIKSFGKNVWTYEAQGPGRGKDPYDYYRLMCWRAFARGQSGAGFWVYHDGVKWKDGPTPWDDTLNPRGYYGVIYSGQSSPFGRLQENIVPSRRWEAWREGVEDYEYLYQIKKKIDQLSMVDKTRAKQCGKELEQQVRIVLDNKNDRSQVYKVRRKLSELMKELRESP